MDNNERESLRLAFAELPTGNISDAMDALDLPRGAVRGLRPLTPGQRAAAGFALTILQTRRQSKADGKSLALHGEIIDRETRPGSLIVIDMQGITEVCTGGALQANLAKLRGAAGYLTNGCVRDAEELAALDFPLYCAGFSPVKSGQDVETLGVNLPVYLGGVPIFPDDLVVMDASGVVVVPQRHLTAVLQEAQAIQAREAVMLRLLCDGMSLADARACAKR